MFHFRLKHIAPMLAFGFAARLPVYAGIVPPTLDLSINGQPVSVTVSAASNDASTNVSTESGDIQTADLLLQYSFTADSDPLLTYGFSAVNLTGTPLVISEEFSTPVTGGPLNEAIASLSVSAVPGFNGFGLVASGPNSVAIATATDAGGNIDNLNVGLGGNCPALTRAGSCYAVTTSSLFDLQEFSALNVYVDFTLEGLGSSVTVDGSVDLLDPPAPEAGTVALTGAGLVSIFWSKRKRSSQRRLG